jgi:hypothetical protein
MKKKYALINSYFKVAKLNGLPDTILEIVKYEKEHGELPFRYDGNNWVYDAFCEYQKRAGVISSQYLTPDATAERMMHFAGKYFSNSDVLEPCCGTGQISKELIKCGYSVTAFDCDPTMCWICDMLYPELKQDTKCHYFQNFRYGKHNQIIANPPYETRELTEFLNWILERQTDGGISILLLPKGFILKDKPKALLQTIQNFGVLEKEDMREEFERTKIRAEIVVLKKL